MIWIVRRDFIYIYIYIYIYILYIYIYIYIYIYQITSHNPYHYYFTPEGGVGQMKWWWFVYSYVYIYVLFSSVFYILCIYFPCFKFYCLNIFAAVILVASVTSFPVGLDSKFAKHYCPGAKLYWGGTCQPGWAYILAVMSTALSIFCPFLSQYTDFYEDSSTVPLISAWVFLAPARTDRRGDDDQTLTPITPEWTQGSSQMRRSGWSYTLSA